VHVKEAGAERLVGSIGPGLLALVGIERGDTDAQARRLLERILAYRMFDDGEGRMNLDIRQVQGELMLVSQFTLAADTDKGNRPSFSSAADPAEGKRLFDMLHRFAEAELGECATGEFGAHMAVRLVNDGPVTFQLRVPPPSAR